jgi:large subunit ribosomal protein L17
VSGRHLGRDTAHRKALYRNLVTELLRHERITTTHAKALEIRPMAEKMITLAKRGDIHARRQALSFVYDPKVVKKTFDEIGPRMADRPGGYTRLTSLEPRKGDGARMTVIELVDYVEAPPTPRPRRVAAAPVAAAAAAAPASAVALDDADDAPAEAEGDRTEAAEAADVVESAVSDEAPDETIETPAAAAEDGNAPGAEEANPGAGEGGAEE